MTKELTVMAECVDSRSGTRFQPGDIFKPAPGVDQAARLVAAGCLPKGAVELAETAAAENEKAAAALQALQAAEADHAAATVALADAENALSGASASDKKEAAAAVAAAKTAVEESAKTLAALKKA